MPFLGQILPWQTNSIFVIKYPRFRCGYYSTITERFQERLLLEEKLAKISDFCLMRRIFFHASSTANAVPLPLKGKAFPSIGKSYAINIDAEKTAFEQRGKHRKNGHKNPLILAAFAEMDGQR